MLPSIIILLAFIGLSLCVYPFLIKGIDRVLSLEMQKFVYHYYIFTVAVMCLFLFISTIFGLLYSRNLVGSFGRIIYELDEIIAGRTKKTIRTRSNDYLANEILKRINYLVKNFVVFTHENKNNLEK